MVIVMAIYIVTVVILMSLANQKTKTIDKNKSTSSRRGCRSSSSGSSSSSSSSLRIHHWDPVSLLLPGRQHDVPARTGPSAQRARHWVRCLLAPLNDKGASGLWPDCGSISWRNCAKQRRLCLRSCDGQSRWNVLTRHA